VTGGGAGGRPLPRLLDPSPGPLRARGRTTTDTRDGMRIGMRGAEFGDAPRGREKVAFLGLIDLLTSRRICAARLSAREANADPAPCWTLQASRLSAK
jgi:hypothetical protein